MNTDSIRYQKTEAKIMDAFFQLMKKKGFEDLTVKDILDLAAISKSTFYVHYADKFELLDAFENALLDRFVEGEETMSAAWFSENRDFNMDKLPHLDTLFHIIYEDSEKYALLFSDKGDRIVFQEKFQKTIHEVWKRIRVTAKEPIPTNYALAAIENVVIGLIQEWVKGGCKETEEEFKVIFVGVMKSVTPNLIVSRILF